MQCRIYILPVDIFDSAELNTLDDYVGPFIKLYVIFNSYVSTMHNHKIMREFIQLKIDFITA